MLVDAVDDDVTPIAARLASCRFVDRRCHRGMVVPAKVFFAEGGTHRANDYRGLRLSMGYFETATRTEAATSSRRSRQAARTRLSPQLVRTSPMTIKAVGEPRPSAPFRCQLDDPRTNPAKACPSGLPRWSQSSHKALCRSSLGSPLPHPHLFQHRDGLRQLRIEVSFQDIQHFDQNRVTERIEDLVAFLPVHHDLFAPQDREMLRSICLFDTELFDQLMRRHLAVP